MPDDVKTADAATTASPPPPPKPGAKPAAKAAKPPQRKKLELGRRLHSGFIRGGRWIVLLACLGLFGLRLWDPPILDRLRVQQFDLMQVMHPRETPEPLVMVVDIDEASLEALGQWPWPRTTLAKLLYTLSEAGAALVGFDVVFGEDDRLSPPRLADAVSGLSDAQRAALRALPDNDAIFAKALTDTSAVLGLAAGIYDEQLGPRPKAPALAALNGDPKPYLFAFPSIVGNIPVLENAAGGRGLFVVNPEADGVVRRVPVVGRVGDVVYPALSLEMLRVATGASTILVRSNPPFGIKDVILQGPNPYTFGTDANGRLYPHYSKSPKKRYISAKDVLDGTFPQGAFDGKLVLVGASAAGLRDIRATPIEPQLPGVEVHAQLLESVLTVVDEASGRNALLQRSAESETFEPLLVLGVALVMMAALAGVGAKWSFLVFLTITGGLALWAWRLFLGEGVLIDVATPIVAGLVVFVVLVYLTSNEEAEARRKVRSAFGLYLSPVMVERVAADPGALKLGGEMRDMTLMFCDLRGFTTISEMFDAEGLTRLINRFLTPMTDVIQSRMGTIDKYIGDCIMAFWNAPLDDPDHRRNAYLASLEMRTSLAALNTALEAEAKQEGRPHIPLKIGVGLNSGECCVGNMGSEQRLNYSVLGDTVNLASRLEGQSKTYTIDLLFGETTAAGLPDMAILEIDMIQVKGKTVPVRVFAGVGDEALAQTPEFKLLKETNAAMLRAYRTQRWDEADAAIARALPLATPYHVEGIYKCYADRVAEMRDDPPGADWDGVYVAKTK